MRRVQHLYVVGATLGLVVLGTVMGVAAALSQSPVRRPIPPPPQPMKSAPIRAGVHSGLLPLVMPASDITPSSKFIFGTHDGASVSGRLASNATLAVDGQVTNLSAFEKAMAEEAPVTVDVRVERVGVIDRIEIHMYGGSSAIRRPSRRSEPGREAR